MIDVWTFAQTLNNKPVAVFGLGASNRAVVRALDAAGVETATGDDDPAKQGVNLLEDDLSRYACLVLAPGIPLSHPVPEKARAAGIEIICDIEILHRCRHGRLVIGVTGTNGKSTTTALIGHILKENGITVAVGGNIGTPALELDLPPPDGVFVLELSSYQLDLCPVFAPEIGVLLNITPDHIDHHGSMDSYIEAKKKIFRGGGHAVVATDDDICRAIADEVERQGLRAVHPVSINDGNLPACPALPGAHNRQNMAAACAVAWLAGLEPEAVAPAAARFSGLPHRQQPVRTLGGMNWVNDSKATNAGAAANALSCYDNIYWIAGGRPKEGGLSGLESFAGRIRHAFLIGEAQDMFSQWMAARGIAHDKCGTLDRAVAAAHAMTKGKTGTVLLSPACASFDQFDNFERRGEAFITMVNNLKESGR